jgi:hypothetical protein
MILAHAPGSKMTELYQHPEDDFLREEMERAFE